MRVALPVVVVAAVALLLPIDPASDPSGIEPLERVVLTDPVGDVWAADETSWIRGPAVGTPAIDVVRAVVDHRMHGVRLRISFTELAPVADRSFVLGIRTREAHLVVTLNHTAQEPAGVASLSTAGVEIRCSALSHKVLPERDLVWIRVPRQCLDRPAWIRASVWSWLWSSGLGTTAGSFTDNPHNSGFRASRIPRLGWPGMPSPRPRWPSSIVLDDPTGDVWTPAQGYLPATAPSVADVVRAVFWHRSDRLEVRLRFADLRETLGTQIVALWITAETGDYYAGIEVGPPHPTGRHYLIGPMAGSVPCPGMRRRIDRERDLMALTIPRGCLGDPMWLRVTLDSYFYPPSHELNGAEFVDNPHNDSWESETTPWLFHSVVVSI